MHKGVILLLKAADKNEAIESGNFDIPENMKGWWAVVVDMHN